MKKKQKSESELKKLYPLDVATEQYCKKKRNAALKLERQINRLVEEFEKKYDLEDGTRIVDLMLRDDQRKSFNKENRYFFWYRS